MRRLKVLVAAYACDPTRGSEMAVGWGWATAIARNHDVWVLCAEWQRENIERFIARSGKSPGNLRFVYVTRRSWHYTEPHRFWQLCERSVLKPILHWSYRIWQRDAYAEALQLHRTIGFDVAHQITFVGFRFPGHLWKLEIPFIWGPIGGLENTPWHLLPSMGARGTIYYAARNLVNSAHKRFLRGPRKAFARTDGGVIAATSGIRDEIMRWYGVPSHVICEVGTPMEPANDYPVRAPGEPLRLAWSGRFLPGKALQLLLRALHKIGERADWRLDIYGEGPCRERWQALAGRLGLASRCAWHGQVSRDEAIRGLHRAHLFVITSLKDLTSTVTLEALAQGVPVLCPDHCGFSDVITDECGIRLPIGSVGQFQDGLIQAVGELASDEERRRRLARGALRRAGDFSWEAKAAAIEGVYERVMGIRPARQPAAVSTIDRDARVYS